MRLAAPQSAATSIKAIAALRPVQTRSVAAFRVSAPDSGSSQSRTIVSIVPKAIGTIALHFETQRGNTLVSSDCKMNAVDEVMLELKKLVHSTRERYQAPTVPGTNETATILFLDDESNKSRECSIHCFRIRGIRVIRGQTANATTGSNS